MPNLRERPLDSDSMKKKTVLILLTSVLMLNLTQGGPKAPANATQRFAIEGMSCGGCAAGLQFELEEAEGIVKAEVVLAEKLAVVSFNTNLITLAGVTNVIKRAGFKSRILTVGAAR
jgi:copper chaperone CopZ